MYKYSFCRILLHAAESGGGHGRGAHMADETTMEATAGDPKGPLPRLRVGIAGATGYAGQELVRILARHPMASLTMATGSQATSTPRRLPGLARIWEGDVVPLDVPKLV